MCIDLTCWQWVLLLSDELDDANRQHDGWRNAKNRGATRSSQRPLDRRVLGAIL